MNSSIKFKIVSRETFEKCNFLEGLYKNKLFHVKQFEFFTNFMKNDELSTYQKFNFKQTFLKFC